MGRRVGRAEGEGAYRRTPVQQIDQWAAGAGEKEYVHRAEAERRRPAFGVAHEQGAVGGPQRQAQRAAT
ncbi:hypothetical protein [Streptomyces sp. NPDC050264]|uniref:hypothetical protein n=1 Tax=Streptomyces sp. NPDC050264 TaxID=3155038 RepID=UPI0034361880